MGEGKREGNQRVWEKAIRRIRIPLAELGMLRKKTWFKRKDDKYRSSERSLMWGTKFSVVITSTCRVCHQNCSLYPQLPMAAHNPVLSVLGSKSNPSCAVLWFCLLNPWFLGWWCGLNTQLFSHKCSELYISTSATIDHELLFLNLF